MAAYALILAAGQSTRFGSPKQLADFDGAPLLQHVVDAAEGALADVVVVLGDDADRIVAALRLGTRTRVVVNPRFAEGQSTSLHAGLAAAPGGADAVVVLLGDQPTIDPTTIRALVDTHTANPDAAILRARYRGRPGHPLLFGRETWHELAAVRGDAGARAVLARRSEQVRYVEIAAEPPLDVDTPDGLRDLLARRQTTGRRRDVTGG